MSKKTRLLTLLVLLLTAATGAWAEEQVVYTLDGTQTASNTAYANAGVVNQGGITWMVTGNVNQNPWRIGGKDLSGVDRPVWSENSLDETVTKVTLEFGEANSITVNSITMTVAGDAEFSDVIDSKAVTFSANNTVDVTPTEGKEWKNAYYRFVFNVSVSGSTNRFVQLKSIKFYNDPAAPAGYTVSFAENTEDAANWTGKAGNGDYQALPLTGVAKGAALTLKYAGTKKVKSVKAVKKAEAPHLVIEDKNNFFGIGNQKFYFTEGETWTEAMANHPENAAAGWVIYNDRLRFKPDVYGNAIFILRSGDYYIIEDTILNQPIDSSKTYSFSGTKPT